MEVGRLKCGGGVGLDAHWVRARKAARQRPQSKTLPRPQRAWSFRQVLECAPVLRRFTWLANRRINSLSEERELA